MMYIRINLILCNLEICILKDYNKMAVRKICSCITGAGTLSLHPLGQCGFQFSHGRWSQDVVVCLKCFSVKFQVILA